MAISKKTEDLDFDDILLSVAKKQGIKAGNLSSVLDSVEGLSTGNFVIDYVLGVGGLPKGRVIESYGTPSSGKTTMAIQAAALLQKEIIAKGSDERIVYADFENAFSPDYAYALGLDPEHKSFVIFQPDNLEQGTEVLLSLIKTGKVQLAVIDSVAAMVPQAEIEGNMEAMQIALQARLLTKFLRILSPLARTNDCTVIFINHSKEKIDMSGRGKPGVVVTTTPGGVGLKFYASTRIEFKQVGNKRAKRLDPISGELKDEVVATDVQVKTTKNKCAKPFIQATVRVKYGKGFDEVWSALQVLNGHDKLHGSAGYIYFDRVPELAHSEMATSARGWPSLRSEAALLEFAESHPDWAEKFVVLARNTVESLGVSDVREEQPSLMDGVDLFEE